MFNPTKDIPEATGDFIEFVDHAETKDADFYTFRVKDPNDSTFLSAFVSTTMRTEAGILSALQASTGGLHAEQLQIPPNSLLGVCAITWMPSCASDADYAKMFLNLQ